MNAWCIGARRRGGTTASTSSSTLKDRANVDAHASNVERLSAATERGDLHANHHVNGHNHHGRSTKKTSDDIELKRGTRRARVCLVVFCTVMVLLSAGRPIYGPYIDVFETSPTPPTTRQAVPEDILSPPPSPEPTKEDEKKSSKTKKFRLFPGKCLGDDTTINERTHGNGISFHSRRAKGRETKDARLIHLSHLAAHSSTVI